MPCASSIPCDHNRIWNCTSTMLLFTRSCCFGRWSSAAFLGYTRCQVETFGQIMPRSRKMIDRVFFHHVSIPDRLDTRTRNHPTWLSDDLAMAQTVVVLHIGLWAYSNPWSKAKVAVLLLLFFPQHRNSVKGFIRRSTALATPISSILTLISSFDSFV
jgi:hypothetical protein